jgi:hypothetical protein
MIKPVNILFSPEAGSIYKYISKMSLSSKAERIMYDSIKRRLDSIEQNPKCGQPIAKKLIPEEYKKKYQAQNLYRLELPFFWRMLYTLRDNRVEIIAFVLDIIDHKKYNKKFKYG